MFGLIMMAIGAALLDAAALRWGADSRIVDVDGRETGFLGAR